MEHKQGAMEEAGVKAVLPVPEVTLRGCRGGRKSLQVTQKKGTPALVNLQRRSYHRGLWLGLEGCEGDFPFRPKGLSAKTSEARSFRSFLFIWDLFPADCLTLCLQPPASC